MEEGRAWGGEQASDPDLSGVDLGPEVLGLKETVDTGHYARIRCHED